MRHIFQHYLNSLHVYCLLSRIGLRRKSAYAFARKWERVTHRFIYNDR